MNFAKIVIVLSVIIGQVHWSFGTQNCNESVGWTSSEFVVTGQSITVTRVSNVTIVSPILKISKSEIRFRKWGVFLVVLQCVSVNSNDLIKCFCNKYTTKSFIMESVHDLIAAGERLGYKDDELNNYVSDQQKLQREERAAVRQREKEEREYQLEMERL